MLPCAIDGHLHSSSELDFGAKASVCVCFCNISLSASVWLCAKLSQNAIVVFEFPLNGNLVLFTFFIFPANYGKSANADEHLRA